MEQCFKILDSLLNIPFVLLLSKIYFVCHFNSKVLTVLGAPVLTRLIAVFLRHSRQLRDLHIMLESGFVLFFLQVT